MSVPSEQAEGALLLDPESWIPDLAEAAGSVGETILIEVSLGALSRWVAKRIIVELGEPIHFPSRVVLPMTWRSPELDSLFPVFDADIELAPIGPSRTQLSVSARYSPPLGKIGRAIDRALLRRVTEAVVRDFVERVAERIVALVGESGGVIPTMTP
jgi:hypothetical protein